MKIAQTVHDEHFDVMQTRRFKALRTIIVINFFGHGMWDLAPRPGIKPLPPAVEAQSPNPWTLRKSYRYFVLLIN